MTDCNQIIPVYTSYFAKIPKLPKNFELFSIAGYAPPGITVNTLPIFAPKKEWWNIWHDRFKDNLESEESIRFYTDAYQNTVLSLVSITAVRTILSIPGKTACLLCYERPERFCHRHIVAEFLNNNGFKVEEYII